MDVTAVIRRLRAEPLSPRVQPTYCVDVGESPMSRTASAPACTAARTSLESAPDMTRAASGEARVRAAACCKDGAGVNDCGGSGVDGLLSVGAQAAVPSSVTVTCQLAVRTEVELRPEAAAEVDDCAGASGAGSGPEQATPGGAYRVSPASAYPNPFAAGCSDSAAAAAEENSGALRFSGGANLGRDGGEAAGVGGAALVAHAAVAVESRKRCSAACSGCLNCVGIKVRAAGAPASCRLCSCESHVRQILRLR